MRNQMNQMNQANQGFEALSRICLNNWHYIRHRVLTFHEGVNFFTGHSGSGKSTVIDAMQIVLYANTDGRGFFNKAAADDSDRSLIEYLRGMVNIGEDEKFSYLRNQNFSSTIVLELTRTDTGERQCVGVVFDVETATNEITRMFFWHKGPMPDHAYRLAQAGRTMSTEEVKAWLLENFTKETCYFGSHNERFRKLLYDCYLGGLDAEKFPLLFRRAIPFRMNIKLEEFVKEYICTEQDIHIEEMQASVMEYGRMQRKIEDTCREIGRLKDICGQYGAVEACRKEEETYSYYGDKLEILSLRQAVSESGHKIQALTENQAANEEQKTSLNQEIAQLTQRSEALLGQIAGTGYQEKKEQLAAVNALIERLAASRGRWEKTAEGLAAWEEEDCVSNQTLWDIEAFREKSICPEALERLKGDLLEIRKDVSKQQQETQASLRDIRRNREQAEAELRQLKGGGKAYPKELEEARDLIQRGLFLETGRSVQVDILADLLEIRDESWRDAVEGYMGSNKLALVVEPRYAREAMKVYEKLDGKKFWRAAVLDTERILKDSHPVLAGALSEEVKAGRDYVRAYIDFLLGKVIKCENLDELRLQRIGITRDCMLYHSYRLQRINPVHYTTSAYIGKSSVRRRIRLLEKTIAEFDKKAEPLQALIKEGDRVLALEHLSQDAAVYGEWKLDMESCGEKCREKEALEAQLEALRRKNVEQWEQERQALLGLLDRRREVLRETEQREYSLAREKEEENKRLLALGGELAQKERALVKREDLEGSFAVFLEENASRRYDQLKEDCQAGREKAGAQRQKEYETLLNLRMEYLREYQNRGFSPTAEDNREYEELLSLLNDDRLEDFRARAAVQARIAVEHFKDDFMYKIRSAIKEALIRKDELNRIISRLDFGKDRYQFYIGKNKGADGQYYDMFMDESLEINPSDIDIGMDNQLNLFTMAHENQYGPMINDLINIFIPPENATAQELEQARRNMEKYADYRTYLSFDMQQIIDSEDETIKIRLSRMIKKNSGGEGQNPLYVALLASFAQAYRIDAKPGLRRNPTIRLVVLDEAFSKMDAEKVASCIKLIRGLGFQAIISATNDKIQNYLETVDKIFVFANPNKKSISIEEFEKKEFGELAAEGE